MSTPETDLLEVTVADGKYTVRQHADGRLFAFRHGEIWQDLTGNNLVLSLAQEHANLSAELVELRKDKERINWLERWMMSLCRLTSPDMGGLTHSGQYHNPAKERGEAGPSYLRMQGRSIRAAIDNAREHDSR